jgi:hypothetical protein
VGDPETLQPETLIFAIQDDDTLTTGTHTSPHAPVCPYNKKVINGTSHGHRYHSRQANPPIHHSIGGEYGSASSTTNCI